MPPQCAEPMDYTKSVSRENAPAVTTESTLQRAPVPLPDSATEGVSASRPVGSQPMKNLALLHIGQNGLGHLSVVLSRMDFARLQKDSPHIGDAFPRKQHLIVALNHGMAGPQDVRKLEHGKICHRDS
jgi:hypothetical protein